LDFADKLNEYWETKNGANQINCFTKQSRFEPSKGGNVVDIEETLNAFTQVFDNASNFLSIIPNEWCKLKVIVYSRALITFFGL